jgi:hypothetical protein
LLLLNQAAQFDVLNAAEQRATPFEFESRHSGFSMLTRASDCDAAAARDGGCAWYSSIGSLQLTASLQPTSTAKNAEQPDNGCSYVHVFAWFLSVMQNPFCALLCCCCCCSSVLLLQDKTPIGRIEEVFGPVTEPLYALRYAGPQPPPEGLARDARVFFTDALAQLVEDDVYTTGAAGLECYLCLGFCSRCTRVLHGCIGSATGR